MVTAGSDSMLLAGSHKMVLLCTCRSQHIVIAAPLPIRCQLQIVTHFTPFPCHPQGLASIIQHVDLNRVSQGMSATLQAGIDPAALIQRFQQSPTLAKAMENPRVLAALMDMARWGHAQSETVMVRGSSSHIWSSLLVVTSCTSCRPSSRTCMYVVVRVMHAAVLRHSG
jgi:hypothetical protein